jgi:hypothetical protein
MEVSMDEREMFNEINMLIGSVAKGLDVGEMEVVTAIEEGRLGLELKTDAQGQSYVEATCDEKIAHIYPGAVYRPEAPPEAEDEDESCGSGCSCGH